MEGVNLLLSKHIEEISKNKTLQNGVQLYNSLITGIFLQVSCSMIKVRRAYPEIDGNSTSVKIRSMFWDRDFNTSHACKPSETAATASKEKSALFS